MSFPRDESWQALPDFFKALLTFIYRKYGGVYHPLLLEQAPTGLKLFKTETYSNVYKEHRRIKSSCEVRGEDYAIREGMAQNLSGSSFLPTCPWNGLCRKERRVIRSLYWITSRMAEK